MTPHPRNTIRTFALVCVAITSAFILAMIVWSTFILSAPEWCGRALGAEKASPGRTLEGLKACITLMGQQVSALAWNSHIYAVTISLCLVALMLIVVAGGRISFTASKSGVSGNIARDDPGDDPTPVTVVNPPSAPVPTIEAPKSELPPMEPKP
jgi:hypothetical protein